MPTQSQLAANRSNAQLSTGPRTADGKIRSAANALKTGLFSAKPLLPDEDPAEYDAFQSACLAELNPGTPIQLTHAHQIILISWKLRRIPSIEASLLEEERQYLLEHLPDQDDDSDDDDCHDDDDTSDDSDDDNDSTDNDSDGDNTDDNSSDEGPNELTDSSRIHASSLCDHEISSTDRSGNMTRSIKRTGSPLERLHRQHMALLNKLSKLMKDYRQLQSSPFPIPDPDPIPDPVPDPNADRAAIPDPDPVSVNPTLAPTTLGSQNEPNSPTQTAENQPAPLNPAGTEAGSAVPPAQD